MRRGSVPARLHLDADGSVDVDAASCAVSATAPASFANRPPRGAILRKPKWRRSNGPDASHGRNGFDFGTVRDLELSK